MIAIVKLSQVTYVHFVTIPKKDTSPLLGRFARPTVKPANVGASWETLNCSMLGVGTHTRTHPAGQLSSMRVSFQVVHGPWYDCRSQFCPNLPSNESKRLRIVCHLLPYIIPRVCLQKWAFVSTTIAFWFGMPNVHANMA